MVEVTVGDGVNNDLRTRGTVTTGHSNLVVVLTFLLGALITGCPLGESAGLQTLVHPLPFPSQQIDKTR